MTIILVIEDTDSLREEIMEALACEGFDVLGAGNGVDGVEVARSHLPDLVICDVMMPQLDGYGTLKALRQEPATAAIPFIFLTAKTNKVDVRQGMDLGADDYLTKPFTTTELLAAIEARLKKQSSINERVQTELNALRNSISLSLPHELRTPLNGIIGFSELLIEFLRADNQPEMLDMAQNIYTSAKILHRVIQNFLLYAELEIAASQPERSKLVDYEQTTSVLDVVTEISQQKALQSHRSQDLHLDLQDAMVRISTAKLRKIVEELIDNSFKYSLPNSPVKVVGSPSQAMFELSFIDHGRGLTVEQIKNIGAYIQFERKLYEQQGSGLGLTIALRLAELHQGKITIESSPGQQTTVHLSLPLA